MGWKTSVRPSFSYCSSEVSAVEALDLRCVCSAGKSRLMTVQRRWAQEVVTEVGEMAGLEERKWDGLALSSISTGCLLKGKGEAVSATEVGCEGCGYAIGTTVELGLEVEVDRLLVRQEYR
jgi:hypothetical protein